MLISRAHRSHVGTALALWRMLTRGAVDPHRGTAPGSGRTGAEGRQSRRLAGVGLGSRLGVFQGGGEGSLWREAGLECFFMFVWSMLLSAFSTRSSWARGPGRAAAREACGCGPTMCACACLCLLHWGDGWECCLCRSLRYAREQA
eukprot:158243-Pelagomonas_calceolata.AAC.3